MFIATKNNVQSIFQSLHLSTSLLSSEVSILSSAVSLRTSLCTGRRSSEVSVLTNALLTKPLESGSSFTTTPIDQSFLGSFLLCSVSPDSTLAAAEVWAGTLFSTTTRTGYTGTELYANGGAYRRHYVETCWEGGRAILVFIVKIWLCDSGKGRLESLEVAVIGLELMIDSTSHVKVSKDSSSRRSRVLRILLVVRICRSQIPSMSLPAGGLNVQSTCCWRSFSVILLWSISSMASRSSLVAPTKLVPLSVLISSAEPRRAIKRRSVFRNESVSSELATSIWTALLTRYVNSAPYRFRSLRPSFVTYGPKKSTPT